MKKFKVGDKVKIIQRKKNNTSGTEPGFSKPNGNVGEIGYVRKISGNYCIYRTKDKEGYFGWFDDDDLELVSEEFALPEKWCIKLTKENVDVLGKWRSAGPLKNKRYAKEGWYLHTPKHGANGYNESSKDPDYTEITFEQFKQHVLKESPVVEIPKEIDMKAIQEEAKKRFPIGCEFIPVDSDKTHTLIKDEYTYYIYGMNIWAHYGVGCLYENGEWAILVSLPETKEEESIPEYVVCVSPLLHATVGKIYKVIDHNVCESDLKEDYYHWKTSQFKPSTKEAYEAQFKEKKLIKEEWSPGTYAVGVKGNFGVYKGSKNPITVGHIYTIKENRTDELVVEGKEFWVYKENLKWFATREEAETFSKGLITGHITIDSSEKVKPISQLWMGDPIVEERINTSNIKKESFIENVQSVNVMLRTKKKSIKF